MLSSPADGFYLFPDPPVALQRLSPAEHPGEVRRLARLQEAAIDRLSAQGVHVIYRCQKAINGLLVMRREGALPAPEAVPGAVDLERVLHLRRHLSFTAPHLGALAVREELGLDGSGVSIGIIDDGIDYDLLLSILSPS